MTLIDTISEIYGRKCLVYCGDQCTCRVSIELDRLTKDLPSDIIDYIKEGEQMKIPGEEFGDLNGLKNSLEPDNQGLRHSKGKLRYDLFPPEAFEEIVRVYTRGAEKYAERNWEKGMKWGECLRALKSHLTKWEKGETFDDELTDCHNMAMVAWNAIALLTYQIRNIGIKDVPGQAITSPGLTPQPEQRGKVLNPIHIDGELP